MTKPNALLQWQQTALRPVELPTGIRALVKLPNVPALVAAHAFPQELRQLASKFATTGITIAELEEEDVGRFLAFRYELTARAVKYLAPRGSKAWDKFLTTGESPEVEGWEAVSLTGSELREMEIDMDDLDALVRIAGRQATTLAITFASRLERGTLDEQTREAMAEGADGPTIADMAPFRRERGSDVRRADRKDVRSTPVVAARDS